MSVWMIRNNAISTIRNLLTSLIKGFLHQITRLFYQSETSLRTRVGNSRIVSHIRLFIFRGFGCVGCCHQSVGDLVFRSSFWWTVWFRWLRRIFSIFLFLFPCRLLLVSRWLFLIPSRLFLIPSRLLLIASRLLLLPCWLILFTCRLILLHYLLICWLICICYLFHLALLNLLIWSTILFHLVFAIFWLSLVEPLLLVPFLLSTKLF